MEMAGTVDQKIAASHVWRGEKGKAERPESVRENRWGNRFVGEIERGSLCGENGARKGSRTPNRGYKTAALPVELSGRPR